MPLSNFPNGFAGGVLVRGLPIVQTHPGQVYWVGNPTLLTLGEKTASDNNKGTFREPFSTIAGALTKCLANRGDVIIVKPGYVQAITAAAGLVLSVAGVAIIGLGTGSNRPTINFTTANTATITVTANNVSVQNILHVAGFLNVATAYAIANAQVATDFAVERCEFRDGSTTTNFVATVKVGTTANIADGLIFDNNEVYGLASSPAANTTAVVTASNTSRMKLRNNFIVHNTVLVDTPWLLQGGATDHLNLLVKGNLGFRANTSSTGELIGSSSTACTGIVADNYVAHLDNSAGLIIPTGTKLAFFRNFSMITGAADKSALENPAAV